MSEKVGPSKDHMRYDDCDIEHDDCDSYYDADDDENNSSDSDSDYESDGDDFVEFPSPFRFQRANASSISQTLQKKEKSRPLEFSLKRPARPNDYNPTTPSADVRELNNYAIKVDYFDKDGRKLPICQGQGATASATRLYSDWLEKKDVDAKVMSTRLPCGTTYAFQMSMSKAPKMQQIDLKKKVKCPYTGTAVSVLRLAKHVARNVAKGSKSHHCLWCRYVTSDVVKLCKHYLVEHKWRS